MLTINQPYIVTAIDFLTGSNWNEPPWLIVEWIGNDLNSTILHDCDIPILLIHVSEGLAYMHAKGFIHQDLKPQKILVQLDRQRLRTAKIADFGITKHDISGTMETFLRKSIYMAPEFWESELNYTTAIDMWSLGVIMVGLLSNSEARLDRWATSLLPSRDQHRVWRHEVLRSCMEATPAEFQSLLIGLLSETPEDRWTAIQSGAWARDFEHSDHSRQKRAKTLTSPDSEEWQDDDVPSPGSTIYDPFLYDSIIGSREDKTEFKES